MSDEVQTLDSGGSPSEESYPWTPSDRWSDIHLRDWMNDADTKIALLAPVMAEAILWYQETCNLFSDIGNAHYMCEDHLCDVANKLRAIIKEHNNE
jgi:hypothetical protein